MKAARIWPNTPPSLRRSTSRSRIPPNPWASSAVGDAVKAFVQALFAKMRQGGLNAEQLAKLKTILQKAREEIERL